MNPMQPGHVRGSGQAGTPRVPSEAHGAAPPDSGTAADAALPVRPLRGSAGFTALLSGRPVSRSEHFAVYHRRPAELSTSEVHVVDLAVDPAALRVGYVIPKRFARRAVTRVAVRRQMREAMRRHGAQLGPGLWALRLRAPLSTQTFRSATSVALVQALRAELDGLLRAAVRRPAAVR
jgi:ribonuclease P protein component